MKLLTYLLLFIFSFLINYDVEAAALKQSTARNIMVYMVSSVDHLNPATGLTLTVTLSKDGGAFGAMGGTATEVLNGWYKLALNTTDTGTIGDLVIHATGTAADPADLREQVVTDLPGGACSSVTAGVTVSTNNDKTGYTVSSVSDKTGYSLSGGGVQAIWDALTSALTTTGSIGKLLVTDVDATISTRAASATALSTVQWTNARAANLDNLDAAVSTRLPTSSYTAPSNASIAAIKAQTDLFLFDGSNFVKSNAQVVSDKTGYSLLPASIPIKKNTAFPGFSFPMISSSSGAPASGLTVSCQRSIDGGSFANCTNSVVAISNGYYKVDFSAADLNGNEVAVRFFGTGAKEKSITLILQ